MIRMWFRAFRICLTIFLLIAIASACSAAPLPTASTDRIPTENWTYDALSHLAAHRLVPGVTAERFMGDWLYSREDMARFVRDSINQLTPFVSDGDKALLARLAEEFRLELQAMGAASVLTKSEKYADAGSVVPSIAFEPRALLSGGDTNLIGIYDATIFGTVGKYALAGITLSDRRRKFGSDEFSRLEKVFIRGKTPNWEWEIGNDWLWWGPGYSGSLILSDNSPSFPMLLVGRDFYFGRHIGNVKITQFFSMFHDDGKRFYLAGRRWEKQFSKKFHFGINETAKMSRTPNPSILVLPSFYLYQYLFIESDREFNVLLSLDGTYKFSSRFEGYFDYLIDDMNAPFFLRHGNWNRPRKAAYLLGAHWPGNKTDLRVEYIVVDKDTYGATREDYPDLAYTHDGFIIGHPVGPNSRAVFLRLDRKINADWATSVDYLGRKALASDGANPDRTSRIGFLLVRDLTPSTSLSLRYDLLRLPEKENRFQLGASFAF